MLNVNLGFIARYRPLVEKALVDFFDNKTIYLFNVNKWGRDVIQRLKDFTMSGKLIRGVLILFSEDMFSGKVTDNSVICAVTAELLQSALLIHDDIMDQDTMRRGKKTIFYQYKEFANHLNESDAYHFGESMGICVGDIAFFLAFENLSRLVLPKDVHIKIYEIFSREMVFVGLGQMQDIFNSSKSEAREEDIISTYIYKTSRYTFSLPLLVGAVIGNANEKNLKTIEEIGEKLGIIFQIKDDEIGLLGNSEEIGKPVGSDIRENKKTFYYLYLQQKANDQEKEKISRIFGNKEVTDEDIGYVRYLIQKYEIDKIVNHKLDDLLGQIKTHISSLVVQDKYKNDLFEFVKYNILREK